jgi:predicted transcriptional regulator
LDWAKYGYVIASEYRKRVLVSLYVGPKTPTQVSEETKLYLSHVSHVINDLVKKELVKCLTPNLRRGKLFSLTSVGKEIVEQLKNLR